MKNTKLLLLLGVASTLALAGCVTERQPAKKSSSEAKTSLIDSSQEELTSEEEEESESEEVVTTEEELTTEEEGTSEEALTSEEEILSSEEAVTSEDASLSEWFVVGEGSFVVGDAWSTSGGIQFVVNPTSADPYAVTESKATVTFGANDLWKVTNGTIWIQMNCVESGDGSSLSAGDMEVVTDGSNNQNVKVNTPGVYDIYFKTYETANAEGTSGYSIWVQSAN